jgi:hypothetical protein
MKTFHRTYFQNRGYLLRIDRIAVWIALLLITLQAQAQVGIGTTTPDGSAQLDVSSTNKGILTPRMSRADRDAIPTPATGLLIFQTDETDGFYYYNGSAWVRIRDNATGSADPVLANGTAGGQVYLTAPTSPYAPQAPQTVTGDVTINAQGTTSLAPGAVATDKLTTGAVTLEKLAATGTVDGTTFLRGDNTWATSPGLITTSVFKGSVGTIATSHSFQFAGPTTTITLTTSKQVTASGVVVLSFSPSSGNASNLIGIDVCYQSTSSGNITNFNGNYYVAHRVVDERRTYAGTGSVPLAAGTYYIGVCVFNPSNFQLNSNQSVNGWVMAH